MGKTVVYNTPTDKGWIRFDEVVFGETFRVFIAITDIQKSREERREWIQIKDGDHWITVENPHPGDYELVCDNLRVQKVMLIIRMTDGSEKVLRVISSK